LGDARDWATYEFPLPDHLGYDVGREGGSTPINKRTVFIVNDQAIDEFFSKVIELQNFGTIPSE